MSVETINNLLPVFLKLETFRVLIVGGGNVARDVVSAILHNSPTTRIKLVATHVSDEIKAMAVSSDTLEIHQRSFADSDLENANFLISAINNIETSLQIKKLAHQKGILINVTDTPEECDFHLGSIIHNGDVNIAISTNGKSSTSAVYPWGTDSSLADLLTINNYAEDGFPVKTEVPNKISNPSAKQRARSRSRISKQRILIYSFTAPVLIMAGYLLHHFFPPQLINEYIFSLVNNIHSDIFIFILAGFTAQMIDGALGMAYGVTATSFLLSTGVPPAVSSASVHASEVVTSGVSGLMHLKFGNVNTKLFRNLLLPGVLGAILGAYVLSSFEDYNYIIKPVISIYTLILGLLIIFKALKKDRIREKIKRIFPLAAVGGFLDSIGGGGWGPIVSSTLIAGGRKAKYSIGSANLTEFFVSLASSITFFTLIGLTHWYIIFGLITGGVIAAPIAAYIANKIPTKAIMILVGLVVIIVSLKRLLF